MGSMFCRPRPIARLAGGAAVAGTGDVPSPLSEPGAAVALPPEYVPPTPGPSSGEIDQLGRLARLHASGALTDEEFSVARQQLTGL